MIPDKNLNIYPKSKDNLRALFEYCFNKYDLITDADEAIADALGRTSLTLNQIEFIAKKLSESWELLFKDFFKRGTSIKNLMRYGIEGLTKPESEWSFGPYSSGRPKIKEFIEFVKATEKD